ncbi:pilus assembly protein N-terminal domain-containing protein [Candidatus Margulisiibacteriota bacterium]
MFKKLVIIIIAASLILNSAAFAADEQKDSIENIFQLTAGTSKLLKVDFNVKNLAIGNSEIADVLIISAQKILVNGKRPGITTLTLWDALKNYDYKIVVNKGSENISFKVYKLNNLTLLKHTVEDPDKMIMVNSEPLKETVKDLQNILSSYLEANRFAVNPWTNSVMVVGSPEEHKQVEQVIKKLDVQERQVLFKVEVYELKLDNNLTNELQMLYQKDQSTVEYNKSTDGLTYTFSSGAIFAESATHILRSLQTEGRAKILASPKILSLDNRYSFIHAGEKIPFESTDSQGNKNVQYQYTGVILGVIPKIDSENNINCWLATQVSSVAGYTPENNPIIGTREMISEVRIHNKGILVLGGLIKETENANYYKIPILGDLFGWIPIIGSFVKNEESEKNTTELVITLKPEVVFDTDLTAQQELGEGSL